MKGNAEPALSGGVTTAHEAPMMPHRVKAQSDLAGDRKSAAEMTAPRVLRSNKTDRQ